MLHLRDDGPRQGEVPGAWSARETPVQGEGGKVRTGSLVLKFGDRALNVIRAAQADLGPDLGGHSATDLLLDQILELDYDAAAALVYYAEGQIPSLPRRFRVW